jgi:hypothetical protein
MCAAEHTPLVPTRIIAAMRRLPILVLFFLSSLVWLTPAAAQAGGAGAAPKRAQAERNAVDLKQGMTVGEVQKLLGKPQRTALRSSDLQWTYVWNGGGVSSSSERTLSVSFVAKTADQWLVTGWGWNGY